VPKMTEAWQAGSLTVADGGGGSVGSCGAAGGALNVPRGAFVFPAAASVPTVAGLTDIVNVRFSRPVKRHVQTCE